MINFCKLNVKLKSFEKRLERDQFSDGSYTDAAAANHKDPGDERSCFCFRFTGILTLFYLAGIRWSSV